MAECMERTQLAAEQLVYSEQSGARASWRMKTKAQIAQCVDRFCADSGSTGGRGRVGCCREAGAGDSMQEPSCSGCYFGFNYDRQDGDRGSQREDMTSDDWRV
jgi:hypothetical protein